MDLTEQFPETRTKIIEEKKKYNKASSLSSSKYMGHEHQYLYVRKSGGKLFIYGTEGTNERVNIDTIYMIYSA
jgi:hypothetical protein